MKPLFDRTQGTENAYLGWTDNQLQRRPPGATVTPAAGSVAHFVQIEFDTQTITTGTTFSVVEINQIFVTDTDYFQPADSAYSFGVLCLKKGLYYAEAHCYEVTQTGIGSHDPSGYPRDLSAQFPGGLPVIVSGYYGGDPNMQESAEGSFVGWKNAVNALANPLNSGVGSLREIETIYRVWFSINADGDNDDTPIQFIYRQGSGFNQTLTARGNAAIFHFPSDADTLEFSQWTNYTY